MNFTLLEELMTYERKGLILSYLKACKLALKTLPGIHLFERGEDKWNRPRHLNAITAKKYVFIQIIILISFKFMMPAIFVSVLHIT